MLSSVAKAQSRLVQITSRPDKSIELKCREVLASKGIPFVAKVRLFAAIVQQECPNGKPVPPPAGPMDLEKFGEDTAVAIMLLTGRNLAHVLASLLNKVFEEHHAIFGITADGKSLPAKEPQPLGGAVQASSAGIAPPHRDEHNTDAAKDPASVCDSRNGVHGST